MRAIGQQITRITVYALLCCTLPSQSCLAVALQIQQANLSYRQDGWYLSASVTHTVGDKATELLEHGIAIEFNTLLKIEQQRDWLWKKTILRHIEYRRLQYHPLSRRYVVSVKDGEQLGSFYTLEQALQRLGRYETIISTAKKPLELCMQFNCNAILYSKLDIKSLPATMQLRAYFSDDWNTQHDHYHWVIR